MHGVRFKGYPLSEKILYFHYLNSSIYLLCPQVRVASTWSSLHPQPGQAPCPSLLSLVTPRPSTTVTFVFSNRLHPHECPPRLPAMSSFSALQASTCYSPAKNKVASSFIWPCDNPSGKSFLVGLLPVLAVCLFSVM